jgi:paraquat-inducible protein B
MSTVPTALREPQPTRSFAWLLPVLALAITGFLLSQGLGGRGPLVRVQAVNGHGIRVGDSVRHLGIEVGEVEAVLLAPTLAHIELSVRLAPEAGGLAREGSRFWIVRPHLALDSVSGLETIIGARYLAVVPGPDGGARRSEFVALEDPPLDEPIEDGGLEIVLEAPVRFGLRPGAPVEYREVRVGTVLAVGLASDASSVEARAYVRPQYAELVREGTRFWESGGFELELGLTSGLEVGLESLQSMLVGGVRFATPPDGGRGVNTGHRFTLVDKPEKEWLEWRPNVPVGGARLATGTTLPTLVRARLLWREGPFKVLKKERKGWLIRTADGVVGPLDLLVIPEDAKEGTTRLELEGLEVQLADLPVPEDLGQGLGRRALASGSEGEVAPPPLAPRRMGEAEDLLLVRDAGAEPLAVDRARLTSGGDGGFVFGGGLTLDSAWHGALAVARNDGQPVGVVLVEKRRAVLAPLP